MLRLWKSIVAVAVVAACAIFFAARSGVENYSLKYEGGKSDAGNAGRGNTYSRYLERYAAAPLGAQDIPVDIFSYTSGFGVSELAGFEGEERALRTEEDSFVEYLLHLEKAGFYGLRVEYFPVESRGIAIERRLKINGETPFLGAEQVAFQRIWGDGADGVKADNQGNEIRPTQIEKPRWESAYFQDPQGYSAEPYVFYLQAGDNTIRLEGVNEPFVLRSLTATAVARMPVYADYLSRFDLNQFKNKDTGFIEKIQGEDAEYRSDPSLYAIYDRSSGITEPASAAKIKLNMIGGQSWRVAGQWIEWEIDVPEDGIYRLSVKARQNYNRGFVSNRSLMIDGEIPCKEVSSIPFKYSNDWKLVTVADSGGQDIFFPLRQGKHAVRLQVTLGDLGPMLNTMEESVYRLNEIYRKVLVLTGSDPDPYRDYRVDVVYPEVITAMDAESRILYKLVDDLTSYSGERGAQAATALNLARQLERFVNRPDKIPPTLANFKGNISSLGDSLMALAESRLDVDYLLVSAPDAELPAVKETFPGKTLHEVRSFLASFFVDYNNLGDVYAGGEAVDVWILTGRDQSTILKAMIDDSFTPKTGIKVNVKLVALDAVMPAVVAGIGPDAVVSGGQGDVVNYAVRHAAVDLSKFDGFDEVSRWFYPSTLTPFRYLGGVYALPETQGFNVMFYRKDIFEELGLKIPQTWEDVISILPVIQRSNMNVGIPSVATTSDFSNFFAQLYQRGGKLYNEAGSRTLLDEPVAVEAFEAYTKFFTHYKTPTVYDFVNRFRTGEMPLGFADYTIFNTLEVFAPEIRGLWGFALMPGIPRVDGTIDRSVPGGGVATMMFPSAANQERTWEFMKWWVSADTQLRFGRELESVMGAAARYATANIRAFDRLAWGAEERAVLSEQRLWTVGTPEVPGSYYVWRHVTNAVRRVLNEGEDTRETLLDYTRTINDELIKKRKEFGLE
jgi:ABC-type glycerol-3-phosphate transport system substrate-binding protein